MIMALDLATKAGFAYGPPHEPPVSGSHRLKDGEDPPARAYKRLAQWMRDQFCLEIPEAVFVEKPIAFLSGGGSNSSTIVMLNALVAVAHGICGCYGVRCVEVPVASVRKRLLGRARVEGDPKRLTLENLKMRGLLKPDCFDLDESDAVAIHAFASSEYFKKQMELAP